MEVSGLTAMKIKIVSVLFYFRERLLCFKSQYETAGSCKDKLIEWMDAALRANRLQVIKYVFLRCDRRRVPLFGLSIQCLSIFCIDSLQLFCWSLNLCPVIHVLTVGIFLYFICNHLHFFCKALVHHFCSENCYAILFFFFLSLF